MYKILFIIPYFGKWPRWMELFVDSIQRNSTIDFMFYTDCDVSIFNSVKNIQYKQISFEDYVKQFKNVLGEDIQISNAYKICDLRPFFGIVHQKEIAEYDFFGWTDLDLVFGDIRSFYTDEVLHDFDVLSSHKDRLAGHCALMKNKKKHREIGYKIYEWQEALKNPAFVGIDEHGITNALQMTLGDKAAEKFKFSTNNFILNLWRKWKTRKHYFVEQFTTPFTPIPWIDGSINSSQPDEWFYHQGIITNSRDKDKKFMYLHFMNFKSSQWRHDGTSAPWENGCLYNIDSTDRQIVINSEGIFNIQLTNERGK